jgi:Na+/proline symporter
LRPNLGDREGLRVARTVIVTVIILGVLAGASGVLKLIINYSFLAFAFRADAILVPLLITVFAPRSRFCTLWSGIGAVAGGMIGNIGWIALGSAANLSLFVGLGCSFIGLLLGNILERILISRRTVGVSTMSRDGSN